MKKRLLILTASTGGGHDARADALAGWARELYGEAVEVKIFKPLEQEGKTPWGNFGVDFYNKIQRAAPFLHEVYFDVVELLGDFQKENYIGKEPYEELLAQYKPQMVISLHDFLNKGYFEAAKRVLGPDVKTATYCGEYSAGRGFSRHWVASSRACDFWVGRTDGALLGARRLGYAGRSERFTFFLAPEEVELPSQTPSELKRQLGLDEKKRVILFSCGRNGAAKHLSYLKALLPLKNEVQPIVVCGLNEKLRQSIARFALENDFPMILEGFSLRMREYFQVADIALGRGGSNTATRAFYEGCPLWFDASEGILPQERLTVEFFTRKGAAEVIHSPDFLAEQVEWALKNPEHLLGLKMRMQALREGHLGPSPRLFFREWLAWGLEKPSLVQPAKTGV